MCKCPNLHKWCLLPFRGYFCERTASEIIMACFVYLKLQTSLRNLLRSPTRPLQSWPATWRSRAFPSKDPTGCTMAKSLKTPCPPLLHLTQSSSKWSSLPRPFTGVIKLFILIGIYVSMYCFPLSGKAEEFIYFRVLEFAVQWMVAPYKKIYRNMHLVSLM